MKLELKPSPQLVVSFEGQDHVMFRPKLGVVLEFENKMEAAQDTGTCGSKLVVDFVTRCGLPEDVVKRLDIEQLQEVVGALGASKKN